MRKFIADFWAGVMFAVLPLLVPVSLRGASDNWDSRFTPPPSTMDGDVYAAVTNGNKVYVGGDFNTVANVNSPGIAMWDGTAWESVGGGVDGTVYAIAISGTNVYVAGSFDTAGDVSVVNIAVWNGSSWAALGQGLDDDGSDNEVQVNALVMGGATLYAAGVFDLADGNSVTNIAKWNGTAWSAMGNGLAYNPASDDDQNTAIVNALAYSGTTLYAGGLFNEAGTVVVTNIAKWNGTTWSSVGSGLDYVPLLSSDTTTPSVNALAVSGGNLYAGGIFNVSGTNTLGNLAIWNGSTWSPFGGPTDGEVDAILVTATNGIYIGGQFQTVDSVPENTIAQWTGANWQPLDVGSDGQINALAMTGNLLYAGGSFDTLGEASTTSIGIWDGSQWEPMSPDQGNSPDGDVYALAISGTNTYIGGDFTIVGPVGASGIANWTGASWQAVGGGVDGYVTALAASGSNVYVGGGFTQDDVNATNIALWNGVSWQALGQGMDDEVDAILINGTDIFVSGQFTNSGAIELNSVAEWDGTNWQSLGGGMDGPVYALAMVGTNLFAGGSFDTAGGVSATNMAWWDGTQWHALGAGVDGEVDALAVIGSMLYVGGTFDTAGTNPVGSIASWDGTNWYDLAGGVDTDIAGLAVSGAALFATGDFSVAGTNDNNSASGVAKWDGTMWTPLGAGLDGNGNAIAANGSNIFVGGTFDAAGNEISANFGIWYDAPPYIWIETGDSDTYTVGSNFTCSVTALGYPTLAYQWQRNGVNLTGATNSIFTDTNVQFTDAGNYTCIVTNAYGSTVSDPVTIMLDGVTVFSDDFESGTLANWTTVSGGTALTISTTEANSGTHSALCSISTAKMYHNLTSSLSGHTRATFWMYDNNGTQNRWFGEARSYSGGGYGSGTLKQILAIGLYNTSFGAGQTGTLTNETVISTNYQGEVDKGANKVYFNLSDPPDPGRSVGWHEFQIERQADGSTIDFYQDGQQLREITSATAGTWGTTSIGSTGTGSTNGNVWFDDVKIEYLDPPDISVEPTNESAIVGSSVSFSVTATGNALTYQWQLNGASIAGATTSLLSLPNVQQSSVGTYSVIVANGIGPTVSDDATLTLNQAPSIITQPTGQTLGAGSSLSLQVEATGLPSALAYQWCLNGANIAGAIYNELDLFDIATTQAGSYTVVITNTAGSITSAVAVVAITNSLPVILAQPITQMDNQGANATFSVIASGSEPKTYQWAFDGTNIAGATSSVYRPVNLQATNVGTYSVTVSNIYGVTVSSNAVLTLTFLPVITMQPQGLTTFSGSNIVLQVTATGTDPLNYDWQLNGADLDSSGTNSLELDDVQSSDSGTYRVIVYNSAGYAISSNAVLVVNGPPSILQDPQDQQVTLTSNADFNVQAVGSGTLVYQWLKDGTNIPGATTSDYSIAAVQTNDVGIYSVAVGNLYGTTLSADAALTLDSFVVFYDGFETPGDITNWVVLSNATTLTVTNNKANNGTNSALCTKSSVKMYHTLPIEVENHAQATFWIYDNQGNQNRWWGEARAYNGNYSNTPAQIFGAGRYDLDFPTNQQTGELVGVTVDTNYYQAFVGSGDDSGYLNLDQGGINRSAGWHEFDIERLDDNQTINFYVDQTLSATIYNATPTTWDAVTIGSVGVAGTNGNVWFDDVLVEYLDPPDILADPTNVTVNLGQSAEFDVQASGNIQSYQWLFNGTNIPGATATNLVIANVQATNLGTYTVIVLNGIGPTESDPAVLATNIPPSIDSQPQSLTNTPATDATFMVTAEGTDPLSYQWQFNNTAIAGATDSTYTQPSVSILNAGSYSVIITNVGGSVTSAPAILLVPTTQAPNFSSVGVSGQQFLLTLSGQSNGNYAIQYSGDFTNWFPLTNFILTNGILQITDPLTNAARYYRATGQ